MSKTQNKKKKPQETKKQMGVYLFCSDDGTQMALLLHSQVPLEVTEFVGAVSTWVRNVQSQHMAGAIEDALAEGEDPNDDVH